MIGNKQDAEDVLQDAFFKAYVHFNTLRSIDRFGPWIKRIVINQSIQFLRSRVHFADIELANTEAGDPAETDLNEFSMQEINREIQQLPDGCRIVFNLYLLEQYSHSQIAEMLDISESTSRSQYWRARQILQKQLKKKHVYG
jgi:RNA polymerase sigma factor (sigma-70 family)